MRVLLYNDLCIEKTSAFEKFKKNIEAGHFDSLWWRFLNYMVL